ncbi:MAG TPA: LacI family DNA-binding transcriptional regulator [Woeseiaceae bacterium]|nr:LacI family DNA-binding transcriptional regulator [Woeseiaceae bacterium]
MRRVNITDVARRAGVSRKSVSRVVNREEYVSEALKKKVEKAIVQLNYTPDRQARSLRTGKSFHIAFVYEAPSSYYVISLVEGIRSSCRERGYELVLHETTAKGSRLVLSALEFAERERLDGLLMMPPFTDNEHLLAALDDAGLLYGRIAPGNERRDGLDVVTTDRQAGAEMAEHLLALGHRHIGFISGDPDHLAMMRRLDGVRDALDAWSGEPCKLTVQQGFSTFDSGMRAARELLSLDPRPTAIFAANDDMAAAASYEAQERGLRIPGDLSIAGFDDTLLATRIWPGLTTVRQPTRQMGQTAASLLLDRIMDRAPEPAAPIPTELIVRRSTGPAPGRS